MDAYPAEYVQHNLPLVFISGLGQLDQDLAKTPSVRQETGARLLTESPECHTDQARRLLHAFQSLDGTSSAWNSAALPGPTSAIRYKIKTIGRIYSLPPRKAAPLPQSPGSEGLHVARSTELHSPLSPLSPGSPVFPDGVLTPLWLHKHQEQVPCLLLAVFQINANESSQDERLRGDINAIRNALTRSMFKTRLAVLLISDRSILEAPEMEDRLGMIRRATNLDSKSGLFFMPPMGSDAEVNTFIQDTMKMLQPLCIDHYRDLTKHARRKKARGGPPPLSHTPVGGASQATTQSGWNVRYEFKQAVFAEFRQEMDVAERHYVAALEEIFSPDGGVLETTTNWSPRWNEVRLLSDIIALRILRCHLWLGQTTGAVQSWTNYKLRMRDLIDRRGKGSATYSWAAWEGRWAAIMSELIQRADISSLERLPSQHSADNAELVVFAEPEKAASASDRLPPWSLLHHPGYWLRHFADGVRTRWQRALAIPEEDRLSPGLSPASAVANRWKTYDSYLVPDPHEEMAVTQDTGHDHVTELGAACMQAAEEFEARQQIRLTEQVKFEFAEDLVTAGRHSDAFQLLKSLWEDSSWREDDWHVPFGRLLGMLLECALQDEAGPTSLVIPAVTWELLAITRKGSSDSPLDLNNCLNDRAVEGQLNVRHDNRHRLCPFKVSFAFDSRSSYVGESQRCQLTLALDTIASARPVRLSSIDVQLGKKRISVRHDPDGKSVATQTSLSVLSIDEHEDGALFSVADLTFHPEATKTLEFDVVLREPQLCRIDEVVIVIEESNFKLEHGLNEDCILPQVRWNIQRDGEIDTILLPHLDHKAILVLPKPPKLRVALLQQRQQYFTDEHVRLRIELFNDETETIGGTITPKLAVTSDDHDLEMKWDGMDASEPSATITELSASSSTTRDLLLQAPSEAMSITLALEVQYTLNSAPETVLSKSMLTDLSFGPAFEARFTFAPRLHPDPWPSYFAHASADQHTGIKQLWAFGAHLTSLTDQDIKIHKLKTIVHEVQGDTSCTVSNATRNEEHSLTPGHPRTTEFELTSQKFSLDDRRQSFLNLSLVVVWSAGTAAEEAETLITVPRLTIPTSEPRVLCTIEQGAAHGHPVLRYYLENPSTHFLTFNATMEASDEFGFSGPKTRALSLTPLSRHQLEYHLLLPNDVEEEESWISPNLQVVDSYYDKTLRVHPGGAQIKLNTDKMITACVRHTMLADA